MNSHLSINYLNNTEPMQLLPSWGGWEGWLDEENGMYYYSARYYAPPTFISRDPMFEKYPSISPYTYCSNNPINKVDPTGMNDGWIKDEIGNVFWDNNTNSQEEFNANYSDRPGCSYVSDPDNPNSYTLPSGEGQLVMNSWIDELNGTTGSINEGQGNVGINISFIPTNVSATLDWAQTYSSNVPDVNSGNVWETLPTTDISSERFDFIKPGPTLADGPLRVKLPEAQWDVNMNLQSTVLVNGQRTVSVGWGFTINSQNHQTVQAPTILKTTTKFHDDVVEKAKK
jgi:RHS repeat-associated protein